jgi:hypothetical protein
MEEGSMVEAAAEAAVRSETARTLSKLRALLLNDLS